MDPKKGIAVPPPVVSVIEKLRSCGHTAFIAGGAVRDIVMNRQRPVDWDIALPPPRSKWAHALTMLCPQVWPMAL